MSLKIIAGVDEAGRGPLFGPVVAAAVILDPNARIEGLADSKKLSEKKREALFDVIKARALSYGIALASAREIDEINILQASLLAMARAVSKLDVRPDLVLVDGNRVPKLEVMAQAIIKGDQKIAEISAASILAKVTRDRMMLEADLQYPGYGLAKHKGYPTKAHMESLKRLGPTDQHRKTFGPVRRICELEAL